MQRTNSTGKRAIGRPFKPGQSGNPSGKRTGTISLRASFQRVATQADADAMMKAVLDKAKGGDLKAFELCAQLSGEIRKNGHHWEPPIIDAKPVVVTVNNPPPVLPWAQMAVQQEELIAAESARARLTAGKTDSAHANGKIITADDLDSLPPVVAVPIEPARVNPATEGMARKDRNHNGKGYSSEDFPDTIQITAAGIATTAHIPPKANRQRTIASPEPASTLSR